MGRPMFDEFQEPEQFEGYVQHYLDALKPYDPGTLEQATREVCSAWTGLKWPPPGKIREIAERLERERREKYSKPAIPVFKPEPEVDITERLSVGERMTRLRRLWFTPEYEAMTHEEAYDAVYGAELYWGHKAKVLARLA